VNKEEKTFFYISRELRSVMSNKEVLDVSMPCVHKTLINDHEHNTDSNQLTQHNKTTPATNQPYQNTIQPHNWQSR
jgi:hypothetical protein